MAQSLLDRLGLGNDRAVVNARRAALRRQAEEQMVADLVEGISRRCSAGARPR